MAKIFGMLVLLVLLTMPAFAAFEDEVARRAQQTEEQVVAWRRDIHQNPELSNREFRTSALVAEHLRSLGMQVQPLQAHFAGLGDYRVQYLASKATPPVHRQHRHAADLAVGLQPATGHRFSVERGDKVKGLFIATVYLDTARNALLEDKHLLPDSTQGLPALRPGHSYNLQVIRHIYTRSEEDSPAAWLFQLIPWLLPIVPGPVASVRTISSMGSVHWPEKRSTRRWQKPVRPRLPAAMPCN